MLTSDAPSVIIYVLLRLFQLFVKVIRDKNNGNTDLVCSILRDFARNWPEFYEALGFCFEPYCGEINKTKDFKISGEHLTKKNVRAIEQAREGPTIETMAPETDAKTESDSSNGTSDDGTRYADIRSGAEDPKTDKEDAFRNHPEEINNFGDHRCPTAPKNESAIQHAPEEPIEKIASESEAKTGSDSKNDTRGDGTRNRDTENDRGDRITQKVEIFESHLEEINNFGNNRCAKTGSDSNNGTRDDDTRFSDIESGREHSNTDKEEIFESHPEENYDPPESTEPVIFSMNLETSVNHTPEVSDGKNMKIESSDGVVDNVQNASEKPITVEIMPGPNQNEHANQEIYEPTTSTTSTKSNALFDNFLKDMDTLNPSQPEPTRDSSQDETMNLVGEEFQQLTYEVSTIQDQARKTVIDLHIKKDELEERSSILYTPSEEDHDEDAGNETFRDKLEEQKKRHEEQLDRKRQERAEKQGLSEKAFRKTLEVSPETVPAEVTNLYKKLEVTLHKLSRIFENLAKITEKFEDALFIRILQKSSCDISTKLISVLNFLDPVGYSIEWYKELTTKFGCIKTSDVPGVNTLKKLCKEDNWDGLRNMEFPKWEPKIHVNIEELSSDEDEDAVGDKPENPVEVENMEVGDNNDSGMESLEAGKDMIHQEDSKTASNSDRTEAKDPKLTAQVVCSMPAYFENGEVKNYACIDTKIKSTVKSYRDDEEEIVNLMNYLLEKVEDSQSSIQEKSKQGWLQKAIASIVGIEEFSRDEDEDVDKPENLVEVEKGEVFDNNDSGMKSLETGKDMTYPEDSKAASNSDSSVTKDPGQADQVVRSVSASVEHDEVKNIDKSQHGDEEEIGNLMNYLLEKVEASQSSIQEESEQDGFQEVICKQNQYLTRNGSANKVNQRPPTSLKRRQNF
ncbi:hypothetical protein B9Z55_016805 [Caenorhabditis nigoni]|uniref:Uncharacterized protein n=1 Tax=Caenorhabditis nigoni TaxID=1611254 RepID=A0A2G5T6B1_9PELO|nr:hypothetical protein B9Z55_016805 [Caenorhabditis nigoni]